MFIQIRQTILAYRTLNRLETELMRDFSVGVFHTSKSKKHNKYVESGFL